MVGLTISQYEKKPVKNPFSTTGINTPIETYNPNKTAGLGSSKDTALSSTQPGNTGGNTALGNAGGSSFAASPLLKAIPEQVFQPYYSGNSKGTMFGAGRLSAIDEVGELANQDIQQKVMMRNAEINKRNAYTQQQDAWRQPMGGGYFEGGENSGLDPEQLTNARLIADVGRSRGMDDNAIQIALMTALTESGLRNVKYGDRDSLGLFQQRPSQGWGSASQVQDANYSSNKFYDSLGKTAYNKVTPWAAAQNVQRSFDPTGSNYQRQWTLAQRAFGSLRAPALTVAGNSGAAEFIQRYNNKYVDVDGAYGAQCVDLYNLYTSTFVGGRNIMVGYADELFLNNKYDANAYRKVGANVPGGQGYVAVFRKGATTPASHVGIVVGDNGNGTLRLLSANATPAGSRGNTVIHNISKASLLGYLVPNKLIGA